MCAHTIDMAIQSLNNEGAKEVIGAYKGNDSGDESYFNLCENTCALVNKRAEEIFISTRMMSLASNKKISASKQELKNDLIKGNIQLSLYRNHHAQLSGKQHSDNTKAYPIRAKERYGICDRGENLNLHQRTWL